MLSVPILEMLTRTGFAARGIMYVLVGYLALRFGQAESGSGALAYVADGTGKLLLAVMAIGFLAYGLWRLCEALVDTEGHGTDAPGTAARVGGAVSGLVHLGLAFLAARLAFGQSGAGSGDGAEQGAATALSLPGGPALLLVAGGALVGTGLWQMLKAFRADFLRHLDGRAAHRAWVLWLGRAGYAARGVVFVITGWFLMRAGMSSDSGEAGGMGEALGSLSGAPLAIIALGLLLFGLFSFVEARYRKINDPDVIARLKSATAQAR
jgi:hypothetical protein